MKWARQDNVHITINHVLLSEYTYKTLFVAKTFEHFDIRSNSKILNPHGEGLNTGQMIKTVSNKSWIYWMYYKLQITSIVSVRYHLVCILMIL